MLFKSLIVLATLLLSIHSQESYHYKDDTYDFYTGYILANGTTDATLFYQLIPAINTTLNDSNPLILWLQGGPGCSSQYGSWIEFGPYYIANVSGTLTPQSRDVNWNQHYHLLLIDNPSNAGFSLPGSANVTDTETSQIQVYNVLTKFFSIYPELSDNDFYIFGESYGGHYVPYIAYEILTRGAKNFNFKGIGIGNAWTNPYIQTATFSDYSFFASLIDTKVRDQLNLLEAEAQSLIANGYLAEANDIFNQIEANITMKNRTGGIFINDFRSFSDSDPIFESYGLTEAYLNLPEVKDMYKVPKDISFNLCNGQINAAWAYDQSTNVTDQLTYVLNNTRVMFYSGADDIECNTAGVLKFLAKLDWPGIKDFQKAQRQIWKRGDGSVIGNAKTSTNLTFVTVYKAGHYVPFYQPVNALDMVTRFIDGNNNWSEPYLY